MTALRAHEHAYGTDVSRVEWRHVVTVHACGWPGRLVTDHGLLGRRTGPARCPPLGHRHLSALRKPVQAGAGAEPLNLGPPPTDRADDLSLWWRHERLASSRDA